MKRVQNYEKVDALIQHFWKNGFLTLSRKYGKYLPEPKPIGEYEVDAVGKLRKSYAFGIVLSNKDLENPTTINKLKFLATRSTRHSNKKVILFVGIPSNSLAYAKKIISKFDEEIRRSIKLVPLPEDQLL